MNASDRGTRSSQGRPRNPTGRRSNLRFRLLLGGGVLAVLASVAAILVAALGQGGGTVQGQVLIPADAHVLGAADASVTVVEFSDFQ